MAKLTLTDANIASFLNAAYELGRLQSEIDRAKYQEHAEHVAKMMFGDDGATTTKTGDGWSMTVGANPRRVLDAAIATSRGIRKRPS